MTPEEYAAKIVNDEHWLDIDYMQVGPDGDEQRVDSFDRVLLQKEIAASIRAAVEAERERCALACQQVWEVYGYPEAEATVLPLIKECAANIRGRK